MIVEKWDDERLPLNFQKTRKGGIGKSLEAYLKKCYTPSSRIEMTFKGKEITFITNTNGEPITLFLGKRKANGDISGEMFSRRIKKIENGLIKESHWDNQGKV